MKKIIIGVCAISLILLIAPIIPAQQYTLVEEEIFMNIEDQINLLYDLEKKDIKINDLDNIKIGINNIIESNDFDGKPTFFKFILNTIVSLIFAIIGTIFGIIFGPLLSILIKLLTAPAVILAKLISLIFGKTSTS
jgi:hypothetical protein